MARDIYLTRLDHPIVTESFRLIDQEVGLHNLTPAEYAIARRVIHATADFEFLELLQFSPDVIKIAITSLCAKLPIITDVTMVQQGIKTLVAKTFANLVISAVEQIETPLPGKTRTETGILATYGQYPQGIYVIGNAPTALLYHTFRPECDGPTISKVSCKYSPVPALVCFISLSMMIASYLPGGTASNDCCGSTWVASKFNKAMIFP